MAACGRVRNRALHYKTCVPDDLLKDMMDKSYKLVLGGFNKKKQQEILLTASKLYCGQREMQSE